MLTGKQVVFLGGDARQLEVVQECIQLNAEVTLIGFDNLQTPFSGAVKREMSSEVLKKTDFFILPIIGAGEQGQVESLFTSQPLFLTEEHIQALPHHCILFTGIARPYLQKLCYKYQIQCIELMERDDVAIYNSIPTVEGALMMAIQNTNITLHGSQCIVLGFGRVGTTLARTLKAIGASVEVGVCKTSQEARAYEMGLAPFYLQQLSQKVQKADILFNTIPAQVVTSSVLSCVPHNIVMIDLASKPGGIDYAYAKKRGIQAILAPSLPGIVAPKTAGRILARTITSLMVEEQQQKGEGS